MKKVLLLASLFFLITSFGQTPIQDAEGETSLIFPQSQINLNFAKSKIEAAFTQDKATGFIFGGKLDIIARNGIAKIFEDNEFRPEFKISLNIYKENKNNGGWNGVFFSPHLSVKEVKLLDTLGQNLNYTDKQPIGGGIKLGYLKYGSIGERSFYLGLGGIAGIFDNSSWLQEVEIKSTTTIGNSYFENPSKTALLNNGLYDDEKLKIDFLIDFVLFFNKDVNKPKPYALAAYFRNKWRQGIPEQNVGLGLTFWARKKFEYTVDDPEKSGKKIGKSSYELTYDKVYGSIFIEINNVFGNGSSLTLLEKTQVVVMAGIPLNLGE